LDRPLHFVIGGAQKSGTCTLYRILRRHRGVQMASVKETHFFDDEGRDWRAPDYGALDAHFLPADGRIRGESTPITLYWRPAIARLAACNPDLKLIFLLRNPVERAFSHWRHEWALGRETLPFAEAIRSGRRRVTEEAEPHGLHRIYSYVERGLYASQLKHVLGVFPPRNVHCEIFEDFFAARAAGLARIASFLGIGPFPSALPDIHAYRAKDVAYPSHLTHDDLAYLSEVYRDDIAQLQILLERPVDRWQQAMA
jgi:hypothetical protein